MATRGRDRSVAGVVIDSADKRDSDFAAIALCTAKRKSLRRKRFRSPDPFLMVVEIGSTFTRPSVIMPRLCQRDPASLRPSFRAHIIASNRPIESMSSNSFQRLDMLTDIHARILNL